VLSQRIKAGIEDNPFFRFYETTLVYPTIDGNTGGTININAVEWLFRVRDGTIAPAPGALAEKAVEVSQHYLMLSRELLLEQIRIEDFSGQPPSRQKCLFLCDTLEEARAWCTLLGAQGAICELSCTGRIHRGDSRLMVKISEPLSVTREKGRAYWRGEASADPRIEILFEGDALVSAIGL
jgi:hypothetical protein